jgi:hypothetical protein
LTNLLPTLRIPERLWSDESKETDRKKVIEKLDPKYPFWIGEGQLYSFWPPEAPQNPFKTILTGRLRKTHSVADWLADSDKSRRIVQLLNGALRTHCFKLRLKATEGDRELFFGPVSKNEVRTFRWGPSSGRGRTLAKMVSTADGTQFGVHHAAKLRMIVLGRAPFLLVQPGWYFTTDGVLPLEGSAMGVLSTRWGGRERNASVLRNVLMWGLLLANRKQSIQFDLGSDALTIGPVPAHSQISVSVSEDSVRLDRILGGGDHAGEVGGGLDEEAVVEDEIDQIARLKEVGAFELLADAFIESEGEGGGDD